MKSGVALLFGFCLLAASVGLKMAVSHGRADSRLPGPTGAIQEPALYQPHGLDAYRMAVRVENQPGLPDSIQPPDLPGLFYAELEGDYGGIPINLARRPNAPRGRFGEIWADITAEWDVSPAGAARLDALTLQLQVRPGSRESNWDGIMEVRAEAPEESFVDTDRARLLVRDLLDSVEEEWGRFRTTAL